jgi:hypothetical protein
MARLVRANYSNIVVAKLARTSRAMTGELTLATERCTEMPFVHGLISAKGGLPNRMDGPPC